MTSDLILTPSCDYLDLPLRGQIVRFRRWNAEAEPTSAILCVHGLGAHSGWFEALATRLARRGITSFAYDHAGFGYRADAKLRSYQDWTGDLESAMDAMAARMQELPWFLVANSMGALVSIQALKKRSISAQGPCGFAMLSPGFNGNPATFTLAYRLRTLLTAIVRPEAVVSLPYSSEQITHDPAARRWIDADPMARLALPASFMFELLRLSLRTPSRASIDCPVLMALAGQDAIVDTRAAESFYQKLACPAKILLRFPDAFHDLIFEPCLDELVDRLASWTADCPTYPTTVS